MSDNSKTEHVSFGIIRFSVFGGVCNDLGSDVSHRPTSLEHLERYLFIHDQRKPEVNYLGSLTEHIDDDVLWFEVSMDNFTAMRVGQRNQYAFHERLASLQRHEDIFFDECH